MKLTIIMGMVYKLLCQLFGLIAMLQAFGFRYGVLHFHVVLYGAPWCTMRRFPFEIFLYEKRETS